MKITSYHFIPFVLPTVKPIVLSRHILKAKKGFFVTIISSDNQKVTAELPVIPGVHPLNRQQAKSLLEAFLKKLMKKPLPEKMKWHQTGFGLSHTFRIPQLLFTLESLLIGLYRKQFLKDFNISTPLQVPINHLFMPSFKKLPLSVKVLKVKIDNLKNPQKTIHKLLALYPALQLRLDANGALTPKKLQQLLACILKKNLNYVEDPYIDLARGLKDFSDFPLALDKQVGYFLHSVKALPKNTKALVIKPSRDLALSGTLALIKKYAKTGVNIVISSAYETSVGLWSLSHIAKVAGGFSGLDVEKVFATHSVCRLHKQRGGNLVIADDYQEEVFLH